MTWASRPDVAARIQARHRSQGLRHWDLPATWAACRLRWEVLEEIPRAMRSSSEQKALEDLARWLAEHGPDGAA